ncbi:uncharacterized protein A4U43_C05F32240 [Asparagus officinalis]|uniref:Pseudouridine synthase RsuA/RluA-like domain-containing protein n=1 Tax=Asparagus officinalis TaxID=4686 RepID=A0A5P1EXV3_ASPOF|nr:RNA pseudouridine synthase 4, mitochondrial [Asparagus officinalis]ONK70293.1 uncharacterized protein A4U43_C05F32240 [Asparagus officinalis]
MASLRPCRRQLWTRSQTSSSTFQVLRSLYSATTSQDREQAGQDNFHKWVTLPPFSPQMDASSIGREIAGRNPIGRGEPITALKWVRRCCPQLPMSLVQKLFRLRQVRKELANSNQLFTEEEVKQKKIKRVSAKDTLDSGDVILLPITVQELVPETKDSSSNEDEVKFMRSLVLYKDPDIIVLNKPPGLPVQGGVGIKYSVDALAAMALKYDYSEPPRLVHRLDRESSGVLVLGRTQTSAAILHSIFRDKTSEVESNDVNDVQKVLQKKYWALVIGIPRLLKGLISAPLAKIVLEDGKSDRITIARDVSTPSQHALTEYKVIRSANGYSWLELHPLTGRKHQLRVHCAEALGTPIVGDYKYGWKAHRNLEPVPSLQSEFEHEMLPFGLESQGGSISDKEPRMHLHCREMTLPNIASAMQQLESSTNLDLSKIDVLDLVAPVPWYMKESWEILNY